MQSGSGQSSIDDEQNNSIEVASVFLDNDLSQSVSKKSESEEASTQIGYDSSTSPDPESFAEPPRKKKKKYHFQFIE